MTNKSFIGILLNLFFLIVTSYSYAQGKKYLTFHISPQLTFLRQQEWLKPKPTIGYKGEILYGFKIKERLAGNTGIAFSRQGQNYSYTDDDYVLPGKTPYIKLYYFKTPFALEYMLIERGLYSLSVFGGTTFSILLYGSDNFINRTKVLIRYPLYKRMDVAALLGMNLNYTLSLKTALNFRIEEEYGFINILDGYFGRARNNVVAFSIGITYLL